MADYYQFQPGTAPPWLSGVYGAGFYLAQGYIKDSFAYAAKEANRAHFPAVNAEDALYAMGIERGGLELMPGEQDAPYRLRIQQAFDNWATSGTKAGLVAMLGLVPQLKGSPVTVKEYWDWPDGNQANHWAYFWVQIQQPHPWTTDGLWGVTGTWGDKVPPYNTAGTWGSSASIEQVNLIKRTIRLWEPAHALLRFAILVINGELWGSGGNWGDPGNWGGSAVYWPGP